jgi:rhodanese-related sulfurtransferase
MPVATTLKTLDLEVALDIVSRGGAFVDLREAGDYLDVHIPGSLCLSYESGPGLASRARDCIPLDVVLVLLDLGAGDVMNAAASLRGKGFTVAGRVSDGINGWANVKGRPASTEIVDGPQPPEGRVLDVGDPGTKPLDGVMRIPVERLWARLHDVAGEERVIVAAGFGVRAALAVGILERGLVKEIVFWRARA